MGLPPGRKPKPLEEKRRLGNPGCRPLPDSSNLVALPGVTEDDLPEPHRPLGPQGKQFWDRVWKSGAVWLARNIDCELLLVLCELTDERQSLRLEVFRHGDWRQRSALRALDAQIIHGLGLLGFNPTERNRLGVAEVKQESTLDRLRRERASGK